MSETADQPTTIGVGQGLINKVQTTADGGLRVTLDFPETDIDMVKRLMEKKASGHQMVLVCIMEPRDD